MPAIDVHTGRVPKKSVRLIRIVKRTAQGGFRRLTALLLLALLPSCYHMRTEAEPITPRMLTVKAPAPETLGRIRTLVEEGWQQRILEDISSEVVLITTPYHFATDTGPGQPAGGRKYYTQLRIEVKRHNDQTLVTIAPYNYEIRTSYAYGLGGEVRTMYKHYPYEEYPGMFDLAPLSLELDRAATVIRGLFR